MSKSRNVTIAPRSPVSLMSRRHALGLPIFAVVCGRSARREMGVAVPAGSSEIVLPTRRAPLDPIAALARLDDELAIALDRSESLRLATLRDGPPRTSASWVESAAGLGDVFERAGPYAAIVLAAPALAEHHATARLWRRARLAHALDSTPAIVRLLHAHAAASRSAEEETLATTRELFRERNAQGHRLGLEWADAMWRLSGFDTFDWPAFDAFAAANMRGVIERRQEMQRELRTRWGPRFNAGPVGIRMSDLFPFLPERASADQLATSAIRTLGFGDAWDRIERVRLPHGSEGPFVVVIGERVVSQAASELGGPLPLLVHEVGHFLHARLRSSASRIGRSTQALPGVTCEWFNECVAETIASLARDVGSLERLFQIHGNDALEAAYREPYVLATRILDARLDRRVIHFALRNPDGDIDGFARATWRTLTGLPTFARAPTGWADAGIAARPFHHIAHAVGHVVAADVAAALRARHGAAWASATAFAPVRAAMFELGDDVPADVRIERAIGRPWSYDTARSMVTAWERRYSLRR